MAVIRPWRASVSVAALSAGVLASYAFRRAEMAFSTLELPALIGQSAATYLGGWPCARRTLIPACAARGLADRAHARARIMGRVVIPTPWVQWRGGPGGPRKRGPAVLPARVT